MKLVHKRNVFLSSADMATGTRGQFVIQLPYDLVFDEKMVFKMWLAQVNLRNTFFYIDRPNSTYFLCVANVARPRPAAPVITRNPDGTPRIEMGEFMQLTLPFGFPSDRDVADIINETLLVFTQRIRCVYRYGRLYFSQVNDREHRNANLEERVFLYFSSKADILGGYGPCNYAFGFPRLDSVYTITPDVIEDDSPRINAFDECSFISTEAAMSPTLMDIDHISDVIIKTNLPGDNYSIQDGSPSVTGTSVQIPIAVPPGANIIYHDEQGVNAVYEKSKTVMNTLDVQVLDKHLQPLNPGHDWSFVLNIEQYEDVDAQVLDQLKKQSQSADELIQLSKMSLLQSEFNSR